MPRGIGGDEPEPDHRRGQRRLGADALQQHPGQHVGDDQADRRVRRQEVRIVIPDREHPPDCTGGPGRMPGRGFGDSPPMPMRRGEDAATGSGDSDGESPNPRPGTGSAAHVSRRRAVTTTSGRTNAGSKPRMSRSYTTRWSIARPLLIRVASVATSAAAKPVFWIVEYAFISWLLLVSCCGKPDAFPQCWDETLGPAAALDKRAF